MTIYIGLGSNLNNPLEQIDKAVESLRCSDWMTFGALSPIYRSKPVGYDNQPDFINAVVSLQTRVSPQALLDRLLAMEDAFGRKRHIINGPRVLDLDILLYHDLQMSTSRLQIPHPRLPVRRFVLQPLADIAADLRIPGHGAIGQLLIQCADQEVTKLEH